MEFESVKVDGGMVNNNLLMQFQSDILDKTILSQDINEITSLGAGAASYIYANGYPIEKMNDYFSSSKSWSPNVSNDYRNKLLKSWNKAIEKSKNWL